MCLAQGPQPSDAGEARTYSMNVKLLMEHLLEFLSLKGAAQAHLNLHLSKYHTFRSKMSLLKRCSLISLMTVLDSIGRHQRKDDL